MKFSENYLELRGIKYNISDNDIRRKFVICTGYLILLG
jgi:hypothetical protein